MALRSNCGRAHRSEFLLEGIPGQYFSRWTGDKEILSNWLASTTSAMMPSMDVEVVATDSASTSSTGPQLAAPSSESVEGRGVSGLGAI
ncbi:MAG: hypothetical protein WBL40_18290 [Terrimicrobiaceae bacterium]